MVFEAVTRLLFFKNRYDNQAKEARFSVGLQGVSEADVPKVRQIINETFDKVIR